MTEVFQYLRNWFDRNQPKHYGKITIENGALQGDYGIATGQYYRILGSALNDGVYIYGQEQLDDETFDGAIWLMAVPRDVRNLINEIKLWNEKYGGLDMMSPYQSESFGGYSYTKASGSAESSTPTWQSVYADRLGRYKKL